MHCYMKYVALFILELVYSLHTAPSDMPYYFNCTYFNCPFDKCKEGIDWGYYHKNEGNCKRCMELCWNDPNCGSIECQENNFNDTIGYCAWWKKGKCSNLELSSYGMEKIKTCRKNGGLPVS